MRNSGNTKNLPRAEDECVMEGVASSGIRGGLQRGGEGGGDAESLGRTGEAFGMVAFGAKRPRAEELPSLELPSLSWC